MTASKKPTRYPTGCLRTILKSTEISKYRCTSTAGDFEAMDCIMDLLAIVPLPHVLGDYGCAHDVMVNAWVYLYNRQVRKLNKGVL